MKKLAPIILFVYNRPRHLEQSLKALKQNTLAEKSNLFIYSDGSKNDRDKADVLAVRKIIQGISGFNKLEIIERKRSQGLAKSIHYGVTEVLKEYDKVIVLEDDIISTPDFLTYMNELLEYYQGNEKVFSISGYTFPIKIPVSYQQDLFFSHRASSWGWGTWKNRWEKVDWEVSDFNNFIKDKSLTRKFNNGGSDLSKMLKNLKKGKIDSWAIVWSYTHFKNDGYCVYPVKSRIKNIGTDLSGVHTNRTKQFDVDLNVNLKSVKPVAEPYLDKEIMKNFKKFFRKRIFNSIYNKIIKYEKK